MNQICYKVMGNELCVTMAGDAAQMELNAMEPVMAQCDFESVGTYDQRIRDPANQMHRRNHGKRRALPHPDPQQHQYRDCAQLR